MNFFRLFLKSYLKPLSIVLGIAALSQARLAADTNDTFVTSIVMDAEQNAELNPGDPIRYTVTYGREPASSGATHQLQRVRISILLSTDGDPDNRNNFLLDFFPDSFPADTAVGEVRTQTLINRLPPNFTGTYFLIAKIHAQGSSITTAVAGDPDISNSFPAFVFTSTTRVTIRSVDSPTVDRVSTNTTGGDANELSESPSITADGRYVVFHSEATNIVSSPAAIAGVSQIYLKDNLTGEVRMISQLGGQAGNAESKYPVISANGTIDPVAGTPRYYVAYQSAATNLISGVGAVDANQQTDIFLYDVASGTTILASVPNTAPFGQQANGGSFLPSISGDGNLIVFESRASNLLGSVNGINRDTNGRSDIFVYNRVTKAVTAASATAAGVLGNADSTQARISEDGTTVVFKTNAGNLTAGVSVVMPVAEVVAKTLVASSSTGAIVRISAIREAVGAITRSLVPFNRDSFDAAVSRDGRYIAFASRATNTTAPDGQNNILGYSQVYVVNRAVNLPLGVLPSPSLYDQIGNVSLNVVSVSTDPLEVLPGFANNESLAPTISGNGRYIGFRTEADDLLPSVLIRSDGRSFQTVNSGVVSVDPTNIDPAAISGNPIDVPVVNITDTVGAGAGAAAYAVIQDGSIVSIVVTNRGGGYSTTANAITVEIQGGQIPGFPGATVAEATAVVGTSGQDAGRITAINVRNGGSGYATAFVSISGGVGSGATATATLEGDGVKDVSVVDSGFGYLPDRVSVQFSPPDDPAGSLPTAVAVVENGKVYDIVVTAPGSGYLAVPSVDITTTPQVQAEATADLSQGAIRSVTITNTGAGYITTPTVEITVFDSNGVNTYTVDPADVTISSGLSTNEISRFSDRNQSSDVYIRDTGIRSIVVTESGSGYVDSFVLEGTAIQGGGGSGARAWVVVENGVVSRIDLLNTGAGYLSEPVITLPAPSGGGTQAIARAVLNEGAERVSLSHYGQETIGLIGGFEVPSSRSITMSSNGRYMLFTSEAANNAGFIFGKSNQIPLDSNSKRDIFIVNRKIDDAVTPVLGIAPTVSVTVDTRDLSFNSTRVISATAFDGGDANVDSNGVQTPREGVIRTIEIYANNRLIATNSTLGGSSRLVLDTTWTAPQISGPAQVYAVAVDGNGNRTFSTPQIINVVTPTSQRPSITLSSNQTTINTNAAVSLSATVTDPESIIAAVFFYSNGLLISVDTAPPYGYVYTPTVSGTYKLTATVVDGIPPAADANGNLVFAGVRNDALSNELTLRVLPPPSPTVSIVSPSGSVTGASAGQPVFLEINATTTNPNASISTVSLRANGQPLSGTAVRDGITSTYRYTWYPASAGNYSLVAVATDSQQGSGESVARDFTVLASVPTAPTVNIVSPAANSTPLLTQDTVTFQISAVDADGTVSSVVLYGNGARIGTATFNSASGFWEINVDVSLLQTGLYDFIAVAQDNGGNFAGSLARSVTVQTAPPVAQILAPTPSSLGSVVDIKRSQPLPIIVRANTNDSLSRITAVTLSVDGVTIGTGSRIGDTNEYSLVWTPDTTGVFKLLATASDSKGGSVQTQDLTLRVTEPTGVAPVVSVQFPVNTISAAASFDVTTLSTAPGAAVALDPDGAITKVAFFLNDRPIGDATFVGFNIYNRTLSFAGLAPGAYTLTAFAWDNSGNVTRSSGIPIQVSAATGPTFTSSALLTTGATRRGQVGNFTVTADHPVGTIQSVLFLFNGTPFVGSATAPNPDTVAPFSTDRTYDVAGVFNFSALVTDSFGNTAVTNTITQTIVNNNPPTISVTAPATSGGRLQLGDTITLIAEAVAPDEGDIISSVSFFANGSKLNVDPTSTGGQTPVGPVVTQVTGTNFWRFDWTPTVPGTYVINAEAVSRGGVRLSGGNNPLTAVSGSVSLTVSRSTLSDIVTSTGGTVNLLDDVDGYYYDILGRSPARGELSSLEATITDGVTQDDLDYSLAKLAADLVKTDEFTNAGADVIFSYLGILGRYPTLAEYQSGLTRLQTVSDITFMAELLASGEYVANFGSSRLAVITSREQYAAVRPLAVRLYQAAYGITPKTSVGNATAQSLLTLLSGTVTTPTTPGNVSATDLVLANAISSYWTGLLSGRDSTTILNRMRVAALYFAIEDRAPSTTEVTLRQRSNIEVVADNLLNDSPLVETRPVFRRNPVALSFSAGQSGVLSVEVAASPRATLQWYKDRVPVQGATTKTLTVTSAGTYYAIATNARGKTTSRSVRVTVTPVAPTVPAGVVIASRGNVISPINTNNGFSGLLYNARGLPSGLTINRNTGVVSGIVSERARAMDYTVQLTTQSGSLRSPVVAFVVRVQ